jgi:CRISPR-associated protein Cmr1
LIGSLRFWFEVICYFTGITNNENYKDGKLQDNLNEKEFKEKVLKNGTYFKGIDKTLAELGISLPSRIFGCTGWKGWIRIKKIEPIEDYCFGNILNLPIGIAIKRNFSEVKELQNHGELDKNNYSGWFFGKPYFYGKFVVNFKIEDEIVESVFFPLLSFIESYGFLGGKWNIGYGRVKIDKVKEKESSDFQERNDWRKEQFEFSNFYKDSSNKFSDKRFSDFIEQVSDFNDLKCKDEVKYRCLPDRSTQSNFKEIIKELLEEKAKERRTITDSQERHNLFGEGGKNAQGTKIIPWIYEENGQMKGGFISIAGIINL